MGAAVRGEHRPDSVIVAPQTKLTRTYLPDRHVRNALLFVVVLGVVGSNHKDA
jgi:hypothetical protein